MSPLARRRLEAFRKNRRGFWSLWLFLALFGVSLLSNVIANDRPLLASYDGQLFWPVFKDYPETAFGGDFETWADYQDPFVQEAINEKGWALWPPIAYSYDTNIMDDVAAPSPPSWAHPLGVDDSKRDVAARLLYGLRISILFGLALTAASSVIGIAAGAVQGYFGGGIDLFFQRFLELWGGLPQLYILIIAASIYAPSFWSLLLIMMLFSWTGLVGLVRAEFLRARNFDYVRAARALGVGNARIIWRHVLPNALVATLTFMPFILNASIVSLTSLDFLGLGMPPGSASIGELLRQGKENPEAVWLGLSGFVVLALILSLLVFIGEAVRDALDPRKTTL